MATAEQVTTDDDVKALMQLYVAGDHDQLSAEFLSVFRRFEATTAFSMTAAKRTGLMRFLKIFLTLFTQPDFRIADRHVLSFVNLNYLISNLVAATPFHNTDGFLDLLNSQTSNFVKILTLYSARNSVVFDRRALFNTNSHLASFWYNEFCRVYRTGLAREDVVQRLKEHLDYHDERMHLCLNLQEEYFASTYVGGDTDRKVKPFLNEVVRRSLPRLTCDNQPNPKKIAVISDLWFPEHSVYRICAAYVRELKKSYHLTFFHSQTGSDKLDVSLFDEVHRLPFENQKLDVGPLFKNDFQAVFFPDIGMNLNSIILANHRIAPIQFCSLGHSVSTYGADIDYFFSGVDVETPTNPEANYSERLVLLPGMGAIHNRPLYEIKGIPKKTSDIVVNCPWMGQKVNYRFLQTIRKLLDRIERPVRLRMFPGVLCKDNTYVAFVADVRAALGPNAPVEIIPYSPYQSYMKLMEEGDLTLDSFHFSGCNTVAESIYLRKPTVVWQGDKWYNRIGPAILRLAGLDDLISTNEDEYLERAHRLIHDDSAREKYVRILRQADLDNTVFSASDAPAFLRAVEYVIANHDRLKKEGSRLPIVIR